MKSFFTTVITLSLTAGLLHAAPTQETFDAQSLEIKQLKRALNVKEQELKILLITLKNSKLESMLHSTEQHLKFKNIDNITSTRVVIKPSMLSEAAIKEIDSGADTDTDVIEDNLNKPSTQAQKAQSKEDISKAAQEAMTKEIPKLTYMKPSTFSLIVDGKVYTKIYAQDGVEWNKGMRFTSNKRRGPWIKITGQITNGNWKSANGDLWINETCVKKVR